MKIEITNEGESFKLYYNKELRPIKNFRANLSPFSFYEDDILKLLSEKQHNDFLNGAYCFEVSKKHLQLITGERSAQTRNELELYSN